MEARAEHSNSPCKDVRIVAWTTCLVFYSPSLARITNFSGYLREQKQF